VDLSRTTLTPLPGGWSGRTFAAEMAGERSVVRIYPPERSAVEHTPEVDAALLQLVRGLVPVPAVLEVRPAIPASDQPGLLVTGWCEGVRGDLALAGFEATKRRVMGESLGHVAATLAGISTLRAGTFVGPDLVPHPFVSDLGEWVDHHRAGLSGWPSNALSGLDRVVDVAEELLDMVERTCLVHSDLNPKNVLVSDEGEVVAVLDWEFAHSGHPFTDLGNIVRFDRDPDFVAGVLHAWTAHRGGEGADALELARAADLWALVDLATRPHRDAPVERADTLLRAIATTVDLHAWPSGW
jgi:aminoglycoside phosphotransferase (APT) family kinase protein